MEFGLDSTVIFAWWRRRNMSAGLFFMRRRIPATGHSFGGLSGILNGTDFFHRCRTGTPLPRKTVGCEKRSAAKVQTDPALRTFWTGAGGNHLRTEWVAKYRTFPPIVEWRAMRRSIFGPGTSAS